MLSVFVTELGDMLERDNWVAEALAEKRTHTVPSRVNKAIERLRSRRRVLFETLEDNGLTFVWELFAGVAALSELSCWAGHRCGMTLDIMWTSNGHRSRRPCAGWWLTLSRTWWQWDFLARPIRPGSVSTGRSTARTPTR